MNEIYKDIQGILALSDIHPADCIKINNLIVELTKENEELKLQLKGTTHCFDEEEHEKLKKQVEEANEKILLLQVSEPMLNYKKALEEVQQKEFIEYINKTIEELQCDDVDDEEMKGYLIQRIDTFKEILSKYKEIIGYKDEQN